VLVRRMVCVKQLKLRDRVMCGEGVVLGSGRFSRYCNNNATVFVTIDVSIGLLSLGICVASRVGWLVSFVCVCLFAGRLSWMFG
jgi:hypothetical protein